MKYLFIFLFLGASVCSAATPEDTTMMAQNMDPIFDEQIQEKVKRRIYPGGQDESDLKVQVQVVTPVRKMAPVMEEPTEGGADAD
jgi:hypothetical protein